jgi:rod shape determining protein RodA
MTMLFANTNQARRDGITLNSLLFLYTFVGLMLMLSASESNMYMVIKQCIHASLAVVVLLLVQRLSCEHLQKVAMLLYIGTIILLILVLLFGHTGKGAQRWLDLRYIRFEPSEIMKVVLPLTLASCVQNQELPLSPLALLQNLLLIIIPFVLVAKQPDLGTATIIFSIGLFTLIMAGLPFKLIRYGITAFVVLSPVSWTLLHDYQKQRIITLLLPKQDVSGSGYHITQSKIAIGSGGFFGKGWFRGTQSHLQFLPEHNTDFIFALLAEEFGFFGCCLLFILFLWILVKCFSYSMQAQSHFTRLACAGIAFAFGICTFINVAMVTGLIPVVGIPLPLVSYGGTTMLVTLFGFGIINACRAHTRLFDS